jgi:hypothetical protein
MSAPEMGAVTTTDGLYKALRHLQPFYQDVLSWERFLLQARFMWMVYRGRVRPPITVSGNTAAAGKITTETTRTTTMADSIIARGRRGRVS